MAPRPAAAVAWALFDFANSAYPTVITTFVFSAYVTRALAPDPATGTAAWGYAMAAAGLAIAVLAPWAGARADRRGQRKPWLAVTMSVVVSGTALMALVRPDPALLLPALILAGVTTVAFEVGCVFYNAMLPDLGPAHRLGRLSGWAWGLGYAGGLACLLGALALIQSQPPPWGLDPAVAEPVRATCLLVAVWIVVFGWPLFVFVPEGPPRLAPPPERRSVRAVLRQSPALAWFLLASLLYTDGITTLFAFGGIYAAGTFGLGFDQIILFGIALNVSAGLGAAAFGWIDDRLGSGRTIVLGLAGLLGFGTAVLLVREAAWFVGLAVGMGTFFGPVQAAGRTWLARTAAPEHRSQIFGLYAMTGRVTAFLGPLGVAVVTDLSGSQRAGMAVVLVFLGGGLLALLRALALEKKHVWGG
ncbi:MFS transporter [Pararhodospirillum photometricum]|uniref:Major facilitator superfamily MFS_1 n=1 Tax=Pararhodospirillum photometricum DSM 122 TaxID=1150469 RepID=H6SP55_PARPM|nr:MFS transporter [Pararhodospirillum photometricum]CCG07127.1 Major facilitator superfamily MFS_1 [Pararhodospirillum photometricum DSM 122]